MAARLAAVASVGAACIHVAVAQAHWQSWPLSGLFFVGLALCQFIWAPAVLVRSSGPVLAFGILLNAGAISVWAQSRSAGPPFGPHAGVPEPVQGADLCALLLQLYVVMGAGWVWYRGSRRRPIPAFANAVVLLGVGGIVLLASTLGVASGLQPGHHGPAGAVSDHHGDAEPTLRPRGNAEIIVSTPTGDLGIPAVPVDAPLPPSAPALAPAADPHDEDGHHHHDG